MSSASTSKPKGDMPKKCQESFPLHRKWNPVPVLPHKLRREKSRRGHEQIHILNNSGALSMHN